MEFILATSNAHKASEFNELLDNSNLSFTAASKKIEVVEDGDTFNENAFKKAEAYFKEFNAPVVSDDSGLVVGSLPDMLGVHSARFAPELEQYKDKNLKLIELLKDLDKSAYFVCVLCFYISPTEVFFFEGRVHGEISDQIKGDHGFGYDPVFLPTKMDGKSMAELPEWKNENSHRAKAVKEAVNFFKNKK